MPRKAKNNKNATVTVGVMENYFEGYFSAIKSDSDNLRIEMNKGFKKIDKVLDAILETMNFYEKDKKEIKLNLWEHDRRIIKLEKQLVK